MSAPLTNPPAEDEIEVSLFGPGFGESVLVHLGRGRWLLVDSCLDEQGEPAAVSYLRALGLDPTEAIRLIAVSHWHDDHTAGIAEVIRIASSAHVALPDALLAREFIKLLAADRERQTNVSGTSEMRQVYDLVPRLAREGRLLWGLVDRELWRDHAGSPLATVRALSPSDAANARAKLAFERLQPIPGRPIRGVPNPESNEASQALLVTVGDAHVLLGADLEEDPPTRGWTAIVANPRRPRVKASLFKVPHHGSRTGQHNDSWSQLLEADPVALVAPFFYGAHTIPNIRERRYVLARASEAYLTSRQRPRGGRRAVARYERSVQRSIAEATQGFRSIAGGYGFVQARSTSSGSSAWSVRVAGAAGVLPDKWPT